MIEGGMILVLLGAVLGNNFVFTKYYGLTPLLGASGSVKVAAGMGAAVAFVMILATIIIWPLQTLLNGIGLGFLQLIVFAAVVGVLVQIVENVLKKSKPELVKGLGIFLPLIVANTAIMALVFGNMDGTFGGAVDSAIAGGLGFLVAMVLFAGIREHIYNAEPPECFKGWPIALISAAIIAFSFITFKGVF